MNENRILKPGLVFAALGLLVSPMATAQDDYGLHGRVSFADESGLVKGSSDSEWSYATKNALVLPGDTLWADEAGTLEVEFTEATFLRLADGSKVEVVAVPPNAQFRGWEGSFYVQRMARSAGDAVFQTPVANVEVEANSQVRFDVLTEGSTTVSVRWGRAVIRGEAGGSVVVTSGKRSYIDPGYLPSEPVAFDRSREDDFDAWNRERARLLALGSENLPIVTSSSASAPVGASDLNAYGDWVYVDNSYYWRPTVVQDYVPYRRGYWSYVPSYGNVWVGHYPFSYVTSHYGYWDHHSHHGWIWRYSPRWRPAYACAVRYGDNFIWSPLGYNGYPVTYGSSHFSVGGLNFSIYASSSTPYNNLFYHHGTVYPLHGRYRDFGHVHADNIYIWNIYTGGRDRHHREPYYDRSDLRVRDYSPRRVMRGPDTVSTGRLASTRVAALERTARNADFRATSLRAGQTASVRTASLDSERRASVRSVRVNRSATTDTAERIQRARQTSIETRGLMARQGGSVPTLTNDDARGSDSIRSRATALRGGEPPEGIRGSRVTSTDRGVTVHTPDSRGRSVDRSDVVRSNRSETGSPELPTDRARVLRTSPTDRGEATPRASGPTVRGTRETVPSLRGNTVTNRSGDTAGVSTTREPASRFQRVPSRTQAPSAPSVRTTERPTEGGTVRVLGNRETVRQPLNRETPSAQPSESRFRTAPSERSQATPRFESSPRSTVTRPSVPSRNESISRPSVEPRSSSRFTQPSPRQSSPPSIRQSTPSRPSIDRSPVNRAPAIENRQNRVSRPSPRVAPNRSSGGNDRGSIFNRSGSSERSSIGSSSRSNSRSSISNSRGGARSNSRPSISNSRSSSRSSGARSVRGRSGRPE